MVAGETAPSAPAAPAAPARAVLPLGAVNAAMARGEAAGSATRLLLSRMAPGETIDQFIDRAGAELARVTQADGVFDAAEMAEMFQNGAFTPGGRAAMTAAVAGAARGDAALARKIGEALAQDPRAAAFLPPDVKAAGADGGLSQAAEGRLAQALSQNAFENDPDYAREYQEIEERIKGIPDDQLKAPNGQPTQLTRRQWIQVRTAAFKRWFGDWEAAAFARRAKDFLDASGSVGSITGEEFPKAEGPLVARVAEFYERTDNAVVTNPELGEVQLDARGIRDSNGHGIGREKVAAYALVPDVIKKGRVYARERNWKGRGYDTAVIVANVEIGGQPYVCEVVVTQSAKRQGFYLHEVEIKKNLDDVFRTARSGTPSKSRLIVSRYAEKGKNVSQVVDENGEPLVVYHGTGAEFDAFQLHRPGVIGDVKSAFFTSDKAMAATYGGNVMAAFLNVRNLAEVDAHGQSALLRDVDLTEEEEAAVAKLWGEGWNPERGLTADQVAYAKQKGGHDGVVFHDMDDRADLRGGQASDVFAVLKSPRQIKSATDNSGAFDPAQNSVLMQAGRPGAGAPWFERFLVSELTGADAREGRASARPDERELVPPLFQSIGEQGAAWLDALEAKASEGGRRLEGLRTAREMEEAGKDPRAIRLATGWEKGKDGKWRWEIMDAAIPVEVYNRLVEDPEQTRHMSPYSLAQLLPDDAEALRAYPDLATVVVVFDDLQGPTGRYTGRYSDDANAIGLDISLLEKSKAGKLNAVLMHEVQHAIQYREGFARGGNVEEFKAQGTGFLYNDALFAQDAAQEAAAGRMRELGYDGSQYDLNGMRRWAADNLTAEQRAEVAPLLAAWEAASDWAGVVRNPEALRSRKDAMVREASRLQETIDADIGAHEKLKELIAKRGSVKEYHAWLEQARAGHPLHAQWQQAEAEANKYVKAVRETELVRLDDGRTMTPYDAYKNLTGEVEARNAERRMNLSAEERRATLLAETEDVAREDQIVMLDGQSAMMAMEESERAGQAAADKERYVKELREVVAGRGDATRNLTVGETPEALTQFGARPLPLKIHPKVVNKVVKEKHVVPVAVLEDVGRLLADPAAVFASKSDPKGSLVVLTTATDKAGDPIVVSVKLNAREHHLEINAISSAYGKEKAGQRLQSWVDEGLLLGVNQDNLKRLQRARLQLPSRGAASSHYHDIPHPGGLSSENSLAAGAPAGPRGWSAMAGARHIVHLAETADHSTFMHELAHVWLRELEAIVASEDGGGGPGTSQAREMLARIEAFLGDAREMGGEGAGDAIAGSRFNRAQHEKFATAFEKYLMEGKAPSRELAGAFAAIREWLTQNENEDVMMANSAA